MKKFLQLCLFIGLLCGLSNLTYAHLEITVHGGTNLRKGLCLEMDHTNSYQYGDTYSYNQNSYCNSNYANYGNHNYQDQFSSNYMRPQKLGDKMPWVMGGDIIYRIQTIKGLGLGIRYQYMYASEERNILFFNLNPKLNTHRIGFLVNYRHILTGGDDGAFIGVILSLDIFRHAVIGLGLSGPFLSDQQQPQDGLDIHIGDDPNRYPSGTDLNIGTELKASNWIGTGQLALEAGFKLASGFLMKIEAGYSLYSFYNMETSLSIGGNRYPLNQPPGGIDIDIGNSHRPRPGDGVFFPNMKANLSSFYITLGIGFSFKTS